MNQNVSTQTLKSLSLELGVPVEFEDGKVFNSKGSKLAPAPVKTKQQSVDYTQQLLSKLVDAAAKPAVPTAVEPPQVHVQVPKSKPTSWTFNFHRNADGAIESITATPQE